jgi:hypothetical protein
MSTFVERRAHPRLSLRTRLLVTVLACKAGPELVGHRLTCFTRDVSAGGLQFSCYQGVPAGAKVELHFVGKELGVEFKLVGQVMWMVDRGHKCFSAGVLITDTRREVLAAWKQRVADLIAAGPRRRGKGSSG